MATEAISLVPAGSAKYSTFNTFLATNQGWNYTNGGGHIVANHTGLAIIFKAYGSALTFFFGSLPNGATYDVSYDGGGATTFTGDATTAANGVTHTWYTGQSEAWHEVKISNITGISNNGNWSNAAADTEGGFAGGGGLIATYTTLPGGSSSAFYYADGWGPTSTLAQLATDLGASADVLTGNGTWPQYMKGVAFKGTGTAMTVRVQTNGGDLILYSSTANGSISSTDPCPYTATVIANSSTVDADGFVKVTFTPTSNVQYRLAIGIYTITSINWSANSRPSGTFAYANTTHGLTLAGDSLIEAGYISNTPYYANSVAVYYWVKSGAKVRGMGIGGSLASAVTTSGAWESGLGLFNGLRLPLIRDTDTPFIFLLSRINDSLNNNYGFSYAWEVANPTNNRLMTAQTVADDFAAAINYIAAGNPTVRMLVANKYWSGTSNTDYNATTTPLTTALNGRITAGKLVTIVDQSTWDTGTNPVVLDGVHTTPDEAGAGRHAEHIWQVVDSIVNSVTINSVTIDQGSALTLYGEDTETLTATVDSTGGTPTGVNWSRTSGTAHTINSSTGLVTAPGAGQTLKTSVMRATSNDDPTQYDEITVNTPAQTGPSGGSGGNEMTISQTSTITLTASSAWTTVSSVAGKTVKLIPKNGSIEFIVGTSAPAETAVGEEIVADQFRPGYDPTPFTVDASSGLYVRTGNGSVTVVVQKST